MMYSIILNCTSMNWKLLSIIYIKPLGNNRYSCSIMGDDCKWQFASNQDFDSRLTVNNIYLFVDCKLLQLIAISQLVSRDEKVSHSTYISCSKVDQFLAHKNTLHNPLFLDPDYFTPTILWLQLWNLLYYILFRLDCL